MSPGIGYWELASFQTVLRTRLTLFADCTHTHTHSGIVLKDLVAIDAQGKDMSNSASQILNMSKFRLLWSSLSAIRNCQATTFSLPMDIEKMRILRVRDCEGGGGGMGKREDKWNKE